MNFLVNISCERTINQNMLLGISAYEEIDLNQSENSAIKEILFTTTPYINTNSNAFLRLSLYMTLSLG